MLEHWLLNADFTKQASCVMELQSDMDADAGCRAGRWPIGDGGGQSGRAGERSGSVGRQTAPCTRRRVRAARYDRLGPASRTNSIDRRLHLLFY